MTQKDKECIYFVGGICCIPGSCPRNDNTRETRCKDDGIPKVDILTPKDPTNYQMNRIDSNRRRMNHE